MMLFVLVILSSLLSADAQLAPNYPINAQLPPVARVSQPFRFEFSPSTFACSDSGTSYSLSNAPSWLHVVSDSRTLAGTPQSDDRGANRFKLIAKDESGSADMQVTLVVAAEPGPKLGKPVLPQLEKIGRTSAPSTIFVYPGHSFSISFASDTFSNTHPTTVYYGTTQDRAPLPSWVSFDSSELKFSGHAPSSPSSGSQTFPFYLIASDVAGFSAATASFNMVVTPHILAFNYSMETLHISRGKHFTSPQFIDYLTLDGKEPGSDNLTSVDMESPDWVSLDKDSISISATPPENAVDENITVTVKDVYGDVAQLKLCLEFTRLFNGLANGCNATIGEDFVFVFNQSALADDSVQLDVDLGDKLSSWLHYTPDNKTLHGHVPTDIHPQKYSIGLTAIQGSRKETREFTINILQPGTIDRNTPSGSGSGIQGNKAGIIAVSVVIPCVFLGTVLLICCCWRRKRQAAAHEEERLAQEKEHERHRGVPERPQCQPSEENTRDAVPESLGGQPPSPTAPKLELGPLWSVGSLEGEEVAGSAVNKENPSSNSTIEWDFVPLKDPKPQATKRTEATSMQNKSNSQGSPVRRRTSDYTRAREPLKPIQPRRSVKRSSVTSSKSRRNSKRTSGISTVGSGLPIRISGAGHGAGGLGPPGYGVVRLSWQNPQACMPNDESSLESLTPLFPRPPAAVRTRDSQSFSRLERSKGTSLRAVQSRHSTPSEDDPFEEFVQNRAKCRNSSNPMFSGQGSRRVSSGVRALERARSTRSRRETVSSIAYDEASRQDTGERAVSAAMSASIYSDDHGPPGQDPSVSPCLSFPKIKRHSSVARKYRDMAAPPPRVFSEASPPSVWRGGPRDESGSPENYIDPVDGLSESGGQRPPSWVSGYSLSSVVGLYQTRIGRSSSPSVLPFPSKTRRASLVRFAGKDHARGGSLPRDASSGRGDTAFV